MTCPNLSNKEVKREWDELTEIVGSPLNYYIWNKSNGTHIDKHPMFNTLLNITNDRIQALTITSKLYLNEFQDATLNSDDRGYYLQTPNTSYYLDIKNTEGVKKMTDINTDSYDYFTPEQRQAMEELVQNNELKIECL